MDEDQERCAAVHFATQKRCELTAGHSTVTGHLNGIHTWFEPTPRRPRRARRKDR